MSFCASAFSLNDSPFQLARLHWQCSCFWRKPRLHNRKHECFRNPLSNRSCPPNAKTFLVHFWACFWQVPPLYTLWRGIGKQLFLEKWEKHLFSCWRGESCPLSFVHNSSLDGWWCEKWVTQMCPHIAYYLGAPIQRSMPRTRKWRAKRVPSPRLQTRVPWAYNTTIRSINWNIGICGVFLHTTLKNRLYMHASKWPQVNCCIFDVFNYALFILNGSG